MTAKSWLNRGYELNEDINKLLEAQYKAYNLACSTTSCVGNEKVQTSQTNSTEAKFVRYIAISEEVDRRIDELFKIRVETLRIIKRVDNALYRRILALRYVYFKPWGYIAYKVHKKPDTIRRTILDRAILNITQHIV